MLFRSNEGANLSCRASALYQAYKSWAELSGEKAMNANKFGKIISESYDSVKDRTGKIYLGMELCAE